MEEALRTTRRIYYSILSISAAVIILAQSPDKFRVYKEARNEIETLNVIRSAQLVKSAIDSTLQRSKVLTASEYDPVLAIVRWQQNTPERDALLISPALLAEYGLEDFIRPKLGDDDEDGSASDASVICDILFSTNDCSMTSMPVDAESRIFLGMGSAAAETFGESESSADLGRIQESPPSAPLAIDSPQLTDGTLDSISAYFQRVREIRANVPDFENAGRAISAAIPATCHECRILTIGLQIHDGAYQLHARLLERLEFTVGVIDTTFAIPHTQVVLDSIAPIEFVNEMARQKGLNEIGTPDAVLPKSHQIWTEVRHATPYEAIAIVDQKLMNGRQQLTFLGLSIDEGLTTILVPIILITFMLYFYVHLKFLRTLFANTTSVPVFPWPPLFQAPIARITSVLVPILILPLIADGLLAARIWQTLSGNEKFMEVVTFSILAISCWCAALETLTLRGRIRTRARVSFE